MKKVKLNKINIKSFTTSLNKDNARTINGGADVAGVTNVQACTTYNTQGFQCEYTKDAVGCFTEPAIGFCGIKDLQEG